MGAARESDQADFDLERFIDMFDTAMTSDDPRVVETLRKLMMIVALTAPESRPLHDRNSGPLRRLFQDMHDLNRSVNHINEELRNISSQRHAKEAYDWNDKYTMQAAKQMAVKMDQEIINNLTAKINGGVVKGLK